VIAPRSLPSFIEDLKVLVELNYDAMFKLTQTEDQNKEIRKYIDIVGSSGQTKDVVRSFVEIDAIFDSSLYPEVIEPKQVEFFLESTTCSHVLTKFH